MLSSLSIEVGAPPELVFRLARDVAALGGSSCPTTAVPAACATRMTGGSSSTSSLAGP